MFVFFVNSKTFLLPFFGDLAILNLSFLFNNPKIFYTAFPGSLLPLFLTFFSLWDIIKAK